MGTDYLEATDVKGAMQNGTNGSIFVESIASESQIPSAEELAVSVPPFPSSPVFGYPGLSTSGCASVRSRARSVACSRRSSTKC